MITITPTATPGMLDCRLSGRLTEADYETTLAPALEQALADTDRVRVLIVVDNDLSGVDAGALWADTKMGLSHWRGFDRIAVATDLGVVRGAVRVFAPLMPCPVKVFAHADADGARLWLRESLGTIHATEIAPGTMELKLIGQVDAAAYTRVNETLAAHVTQGEDFRLLLDLREFDGWQGPNAMLAHMHTVIAHVGQARRIAMVGSSHWQHAAERIGQRALKAEVQYFDAAQAADARAWALAA